MTRELHMRLNFEPLYISLCVVWIFTRI